MSSNASEDRASLCAFTFADGPAVSYAPRLPESTYCLHHRRKIRHLKEVEQATADLFEPISHSFVSATALTHSLSRLFAFLAEGRIHPKNATAMARVADSLLKSIPLSVSEFRDSDLERLYRQFLRGFLRDLPPYQPHPNPTAASRDDSDSGNPSGS